MIKTFEIEDIEICFIVATPDHEEKSLFVLEPLRSHVRLYFSIFLGIFNT